MEKIIAEEAEKRSTEEMFSIVGDFSKEKLLNEYEEKLGGIPNARMNHS